MIGLTLILLAAAQTPSQGIAAASTEQSATQTLEYPYVIDPYVGDYYDCLKAGAYVIGDGRGFQEQHQGDIPRCEKAATTLMADAEAQLERSRAKGDIYDYDVAAIFETVRQVHIRRGYDLDAKLFTRITAEDHNGRGTAQASQKSAECVARLKILRENRAAFIATEEPKIELIYAKTEYSAEDKQAAFAYQRKLGRFNSQITYEMRRCPADPMQQRPVSISDASNN